MFARASQTSPAAPGSPSAQISPARKSTNLTLTGDLVREARALGVNISQAAETGIAAAVAQRRQEHWLAENRAALESSNAYVEQHGLALAQHRNF
ncbi:post-segregation antitoxin CcdA [Xylophilus rhododendri]|uniref:Post-segregation antitoxin CcdA n=1 Tax=Xylophilus rhododendri TaxID=2697032 RepID=A0A857J4K9_9BURK|nr:type II toxin-antitoxin system CcdA family antitoxin [Xylophilus rhododendri]QHI97972.1 post-segregation antitoxin CcdA [Xylophilus rhododendri]